METASQLNGFLYQLPNLVDIYCITFNNLLYILLPTKVSEPHRTKCHSHPSSNYGFQRDKYVQRPSGSDSLLQPLFSVQIWGTHKEKRMFSSNLIRLQAKGQSLPVPPKGLAQYLFLLFAVPFQQHGYFDFGCCSTEQLCSTASKRGSQEFHPGGLSCSTSPFIFTLIRCNDLYFLFLTAWTKQSNSLHFMFQNFLVLTPSLYLLVRV